MSAHSASNALFLEYEMAPQPLTSVDPKQRASLQFGPEALENRPEHAMVVGQSIATWAAVEADLGFLMTNMLRGDPTVASAIYSELRHPQSQRAALDAAAKTVLSADDHELYQAIILSLRGPYQERNEIAHHLWGFAQEFPEHALLVEPRVMWNQQTATAGAPWRGAPASLDRRLVRAYKVKDLQEINDRIKAVGLTTSQFRFLNLLRGNIDTLSAEKASEIYERLSAEPHIRRHIYALRSSGRKRFSALPEFPDRTDVY